MSINLLLDQEDQAVVWRWPMVSGAIKQFWGDIFWGTLDYMVVRKAAQMAQKMGAPIVGLVENMSYVTCPDCGKEIQVFGPSQAMQTAVRLGVPLLGRLPLDSELACRCDAGEIEGYETSLLDAIVEPLVSHVPDFLLGAEQEQEFARERR